MDIMMDQVNLRTFNSPILGMHLACWLSMLYPVLDWGWM